MRLVRRAWAIKALGVAAARTRRRSHARRLGRRAGAAAAAGCASEESEERAWLESLQLDWGRRHLQLCFIDADHGARARFAEGALQHAANWSGNGHVLFPHSAGVDASLVDDGASVTDPSDALGKLAWCGDAVGSRYATAPSALLADVDGHDVVLAVDSRALELVPGAVRLSSFARYAPVEEIQGAGAARVLPRDLAALAAPHLAEAGFGRWEDVSEQDVSLGRAQVVVAVAGLVAFLSASTPDEQVSRFFRADSEEYRRRNGTD